MCKSIISLVSIVALLFGHRDEALRHDSFYKYQRERVSKSVYIFEAESDFVDAEENLEEGEKCLLALKAWEDSNREHLLAAGALIESSSSDDEIITTLWLGESDETGVGPNAQCSALVRIGLELMALGLCSYEELRAEVYGPASRLAASRLGFVLNNDQGFIFQSEDFGPAALIALAVDHLEYRSSALRALRSLSQRQNWMLKTPIKTDKKNIHLYRNFLSTDEVSFFRTISLDFDTTDPDSVDGIQSHHCLLFQDGKSLMPQTISQISNIIPRIESIAHHALSIHANTTRLFVKDVFMREYFAASAYEKSQLEVRSALAPHFDTSADATVVIDLAPTDHNGGLYIQTGTHPSTRRRIPFSADGTDAFIHDTSIFHGVAQLTQGKRRSLVFWLASHREIDENGTQCSNFEMDIAYCRATVLEHQAGDDDIVAAESIYTTLAERGHSLSATRLGSIKEARGDLVGACATWTLAARSGNILAQGALADVFSDFANETLDDDGHCTQQAILERIPLAPGDDLDQLSQLWGELASHGNLLP